MGCFGRTLAVAALGALTSCDRPDERPSAPSTPAISTSSRSSPPAPAQAVPERSRPGEQRTCKLERERVLGTGSNLRAGLTAQTLPDGRVAIGSALGNVPHAVLIRENGQVELVEIEVPHPVGLGRPLADGSRDLQRVTPYLDDGALTAATDLRDKHSSGRRELFCGPLRSKQPLLGYAGEPVLLTDADRPAADKTAASLPINSSIPTGSKAASAGTPAAAPADSAATPPGEPLRELRDCRTFVDPSGEDVWALGSELVGTPSDGGTDWSMVAFVVDTERRRHELAEQSLGRHPDRLYTFEAPVAERLANGSYLLFARYRGRLHALTLDANKRVKETRVYDGGYPTLPRFLKEGKSFRLLTSRATSSDAFQLVTGRFSSGNSLPRTLTTPPLDVGLLSVAEPSLTLAGDQHWLSFQHGPRRDAELHVVPVDAKLNAVGRYYRLASDQPGIYESQLFGLRDGKLLSVFITHPREGTPAKLVAQLLDCDVRP